ncbi:glycosyltransferase [Flavobacterium sp. GN10]|uniref:Glycosyltransferase n=1 Tax=Flavobacterium tagetis TaxID=2801336 RepID=A0ABS1KHI4_9FLAO|nr:glycosyltransferase [Flavobacterium tagetis]MBL0738885.1 glycosyltransferase [Flavobacterium tagetis]
MITIIFPYRDRDLIRIEKSLDSLRNQTNQNFKVLFVDYGSKIQFSNQVRSLVDSYSFAEYFYSYNNKQPWSRSKAINVGLKLTETPFVYIADIDLIFRNDFVDILFKLQDPKKAYYFKVGFLSKEETALTKDFLDYQISFSSEASAQGLSLFPMKEINDVQAFDEFLHFWGAEDNDLHCRLTRAGVESIFYDKEITLLHQWHESYRKSERNTLTKELQLKGVVKLNQQHLINNLKNEVIKVNSKNWGMPISEKDYYELENYDSSIILTNKIEVVNHFLFVELPRYEKRILSIQFVEDSFQSTLKYRVKKILGKTVPKYYSLKEINDLLLLHIISFYHIFPYSYEISSDLKSINFKIKK